MKTPSAFALSTLLLATAPVSAGPDTMQPYPAAAPGFVRTAFQLPAAAAEHDLKVEIMVGQPMLVDCNPTRFGGNLEQHTAQGWGYSYYVLPAVTGTLSTQMACPPDEPSQEAFVTVKGQGYLQRYNSKLPVVVYVPEGFSVRYRIWTAGEVMGEAEVR